MISIAIMMMESSTMVVPALIAIIATATAIKADIKSKQKEVITAIMMTIISADSAVTVTSIAVAAAAAARLLLL